MFKRRAELISPNAARPREQTDRSFYTRSRLAHSARTELSAYSTSIPAVRRVICQIVVVRTYSPLRRFGVDFTKDIERSDNSTVTGY